MIALGKLLRPSLRRGLHFLPRYSIISNLFRKKNEAEAGEGEKAAGQGEKKAEEKERLMEDEEYNFFERRREIDTGLDFSKLRQSSGTSIPERLGEGGIEEVLYWSQSATTPEQIKSLVFAFNRVGGGAGLEGNAQLERFKSSVVGSVYLVDSLHTLQQYAIFALKFGVREEQFWEKVEFKCLKYVVVSAEEEIWLVDIVFVAGQFSTGEEVFNYAEKVLADRELTADQYIKLFLVFSSLKRGEKPWIEKLLRGIAATVDQTDAEQLTGVLASLKEAKRLPEDMNGRLQGQVEKLLPALTLPQLLAVTEYFGFEHEDDAFWGGLERRAEELLAGRKVGPRLLEELVLKGVLAYRLSTDFVRRHVVPHLTPALLAQLPPTTLSAISKGLYIYELEGETRAMEEEIGKLLIGKISQGINELADAELVRVIQDYNLTRHGSRDLYIFFEEVIKLKFLRHYNPEVDRNTIELLISIYDNSGMCTRNTLDALHNLILE